MPTESPASRSRFPWIATAVAVVLLALLAIAFGGARDVQEEPPRLTGELWRAGTNAAPLLVYITMEERTRAVPIIGGSSSFRYQPYARFELVVRRIPSGELVQVQRLADRRDYTDEQAPTILGVVGDLLWVWRDSLEGYHLPNLALQVTPSMLVPTALATREMLPVEAKGYRMAGTLGTLVARGRDARLYRIDAAPPSLATLDPSALPPTNNSTRVEDRFDYLVPPQRSWNTTSPSTVMQKSFLTRTGLWYSLLSESEREGVSRWPSGEDRPFGQVARMLHRAPYTLDGRGHPEIRVDAVQPVGVERLIQAGFVIRYAGAVWDVADPSSSLVLAKSRLGEAEPWELLRLTRDGRVLWRTSIGMSTTWAFLDLASQLAFYGPIPERSPGDRREQVVWIDERSGARHTLVLGTGELAADPPAGGAGR